MNQERGGFGVQGVYVDLGCHFDELCGQHRVWVGRFPLIMIVLGNSSPARRH